MRHYLLIGAGFSYNWGGWLASEAFEYLLGDPAVIENPEIRDLLWKHQPAGGFEAALDELQHQQSPGARAHEAALQAAVARMFAIMNTAFRSSHLEFGEWLGSKHPVHEFLVRFDSIFSLNQDLLLECCYHGTAEGPVDRNNWRTRRSWQLPGMRMAATLKEPAIFPGEAGIWVPSAEHAVASNEQPIFKLHGSSNWRTGEGANVMILGGAKAAAIARFPVLQWYSEMFQRSLAEAGARLMIIGYGFRDEHINVILEKAIDSGLKLFIVDPNPARVADSGNTVPTSAIGHQALRIQQKLQKALIGGSRRPLSSTFARDPVERRKLEMFFQSV